MILIQTNMMRRFAGVLLLLFAGTCVAQETGAWRRTLERISTGVVSIKVDGVRAFDTEWNQTTQATGFIVDHERGLILTNRHVVTSGPVTAQAVFLNSEEVDLKPVYRDPVHDFGLYRYDPSALRFIEPYEFPLRPDRAQVGREIRVVGNDAGEQLSILAGTIAKLDRGAPNYGRGKYNDFNTFYIQAASGTSGGSSGSPVVDDEGNAVALNAGGSASAASSFFLPLERVRRAVELVRHGDMVMRGTLMTIFSHTSYGELRRLGLSPEIEARARAAQPEQTGMLVVQQVVPGSPAERKLEPGDILIAVDGKLVTRFANLESILDSSVGESVTVEVQRGGERFGFSLEVVDLHAITPASFLEISDAVLHTVSYQQARHLNMPVMGVYVANPGYMFSAAGIPRGAVIAQLNGVPMPDLDAFVGKIRELSDGQPATIRYFTFDDPQTTKLSSVQIDRRWYPARYCQRDDQLGYWPCEPLPEVGEAAPPTPASTEFVTNGDSRARKIAPSLVLVNFNMPYIISGVSERHYHGTGLVVDAGLGLVVVDRNTVPVAMGDVTITFAGTVEVPGRVEYIHPLHNLAVVSYDPGLIGDTPVRSAVFSPEAAEEGDEIWVAGLKGNSNPFIQKSLVAAVDAVEFPLSRTLRFRDTNLETIAVVNAPGNVDGVLLDSKGRVMATWSSFAYEGPDKQLEQITFGMPADLVQEMVELVRQGRELHSLETELRLLPLAAARELGLPAERVRSLEKHSPRRRQALQVVRTVAGSPAAQVLRPGDLLLAIDGETVNTYREVERRVQKSEVDVTFWRNGEELDVTLQTRALAGHGVDRIVYWAGAVLQAPHRALPAQRGILPEGVYVAYFAYGSPASRYSLWAGRRIIEIDGRATPDLDAFLAAVGNKADRESVRIKTVTWNDQIEVLTLKLDQRYWPAYELRRIDGEWQRSPIVPAPAVAGDAIFGPAQATPRRGTVPAAEARIAGDG